jgi:PKD repeat protein
MRVPLSKRICLSVLIAMNTLFSYGQQLQKQPVAHCYYDELMLDQVRKNPAVQQRMNERDLLINEYLKDKKGNQVPGGNEKSLNASLIIPVVVYVVHENGPENITDLQVTSQIDALNNYYQNYGIQFCLATKKGTQNLTSINSPSGITSTTPGIFHYASSLTNHNVSQQAALTAIGAPLASEQYMRIWVVKGIVSNTLPPGEKILGYAMFPEFAVSATDGIVMSYDAFGDVATCSCSTLESYSQLGRILVHETGHYLGLYHTFHGGCMGMNASNCSTDGDKVCDTPPVQTPNAGCPASTWNTCSESPNLPDDIHNYMDYVSESCMTGFTDGQNDRMLAQINLFRANLVSSGNLVYTGVSCNGGLLADFTADNFNPCINSPVAFTAISSPGATYTWDFGDGTTGTGVNPTHTYTGVYSPASVVLTINNGTNSVSSTQMIFVNACAPINMDQGNWYFGVMGGMDFSAGAPVYDNAAFTHGNSFFEACAVQSNTQGNLLFYTNGSSIWDANHADINIGNFIKSDPDAHRGVVIVPNPVNANQYYLFTKDNGAYGDPAMTYTVPGTDGFRYSIVQINAGLASMTSNWNVPIAPPATLGYQLSTDGAMIGAEGVTAVKSCNGYWILTTGRKGSQYFITIFSLTASGLTFHSQILSPFNTNQQALEVSRDGTRVAIASGTAGSLETSGLAVFNFDAFTGTLSNQLILNNYKTYGFSFSPDSRLLYSSSWSNANLYQYDLNDPSPATSGIIVVNSSSMMGCEMQLGPDNKLYMTSGTKFVQVVHAPNVRSTITNPNACQHSPTGPLMQTQLSSSMPNLVDATGNSVFSNSIETIQTSCLGYEFSSSLCSNTFSWNFGDPASGASNTSNLANPTHTFSAAGTYTVTVTGGGTTVSTTVQIGVSSIITGSSTICLTNSSAGNYATNLQPGQTAQWSVSGGGILGLNNQPDVTIIWTSLPGTVTLTVTDINTGCTSTSSKVITEYCPSCFCTLDPSVVYNIDPTTCEVSFNAQHGGDSCLQNINYSWEFDFGGISETGSNVIHTFENAGSHTFCLTVTATADGQPCYEQICQTMVTNCIPPCDCSLNPTFIYSVDRETCNYAFKGYSGGPSCLENVEYLWNFGDGTTATGQMPQHTFMSTGTFNICLKVIVRDNEGLILCEEIFCERITVDCAGECKCLLKPEFNWSLDENNCKYTFEGLSGGPACLENVECLWDFGDGSTATGQTTDHIFTAGGLFNVCLTVIVRDSTGAILCQDSNCERVTVECVGECECSLKPEFTWSLDEKTCIYTFEGISGGPACLQFVEYLWNFGDGTTSMGQTAGHVYTESGSYEVCLEVIVRDERGEILCKEKFCKQIEVECKGKCDCKLEPTYTMTQIGSCEFLFTGSSGSECVNISAIKWFVDGVEISSGQNFIFQFAVNHSYSICMVVSGVLNTGDECEEKYCQEFFYTDCYPFGHKSIDVNQGNAHYKQQLQVYPNPTNDQFQLKLNHYFDGNVEVTLKSMDGKVIGNTTYTGLDRTKEFSVQLPVTISDGFIMVEVKTGNQVYIEKLMVLKSNR